MALESDVSGEIRADAWRRFPTEPLYGIAKSHHIRQTTLREALIHEDESRYRGIVSDKCIQAGKARGEQMRTQAQTKPTTKRAKKGFQFHRREGQPTIEDDAHFKRLRADVDRKTVRHLAEFSAEELAVLEEKLRSWLNHA